MVAPRGGETQLKLEDQDLETKASQLINMKQMILQEQTKLNAIEAIISDPMLRVDDNELEKLRIENE